MGTELRWGVVGAGRIAEQFVAEVAALRPGSIVGVASRDATRAAALASRVSGAQGYASYDALFADDQVDAVYIATLHPQHAEFIAAAAAAGKHILCEKPVTVDAAEARTAFGQAEAAGVVLLEAMQYRFQPQTERIRRVIAAGDIGSLLHVDVSCSFRAGFDSADRLFDPAQGGGGILDVGCYAMSYALMVADWATGSGAAEPTAFLGGGHRAPSGVDDWAVASLTFDGGFTASARAGTRLDDPMNAVIHGTAGQIFVPNPWTPGKGGVASEFVVSRVGEEPETVGGDSEPLFAVEVAALEQRVATGTSPGMTPQQSIVTMQALDEWQRQVAS